MILKWNINRGRSRVFYSFLLLGYLVGQPGKNWNKLAPSLQDAMFRVSYKPTRGKNTTLGLFQNMRGKNQHSFNKRNSVLATGFG